MSTNYIGMSDHTTCTASIFDGSEDCLLGYWSRDVLVNLILLGTFQHTTVFFSAIHILKCECS